MRGSVDPGDSSHSHQLVPIQNWTGSLVCGGLHRGIGRSKHGINRYVYIYISAMKAVRGVVSPIYRHILRNVKRNLRSTCSVFTRSSSRKKAKDVSGLFVRCPRGGGSVFRPGLCHYA